MTASNRSDAQTESGGTVPALQGDCRKTRTFPFPGLEDAGEVRLAALNIRRFEILEEIGRGGHGVVFRANDRVLRRLVALKLPRPEVLRSKEMRRRFVAEAQVVAALDHPNVIKVFDAGFDATVCYIAQELCDGPSLAVWLRERPTTTIPAEVAASVILELARGLEHAHQRGVLHRDLKPANVLLKPHTANPSDSGWELSAETDTTARLFPYTAKLGDFGICKAFDVDSEGTATRTGMVLGTAAYMAPEQAVGSASEVGPQSDIYSLGAILYEMLTGQPPFRGETSADVLKQVLVDEPVSIRETRRDVPAALDAICLKCLEKTTTRRYATAAELAEDLRRFLVGEPVRAPRKSGLRPLLRALGKPRRSFQTAFALTGWILVFVALGFYFYSLNSRPGGGAAATDQDSEASVTTDVRSAFSLWHENAERLRDNPNVGDDMTTLLARHIPKSGELDRRGFDWHYAWRLCHPAESVGTLTRIASFKAHATDAYFVTFCRDGSRFATAGADRTARVWDTKTQQAICVCSGHTDDVNWVDFSPDQRWLATASDDHTVRIWDAATGKEQFQLLGHQTKVVAVRFNPNGDTLASGDDHGALKLWSLSSKRLLKWKDDAHRKRIQCLAWGASGHLLASIGNDNAIRLWEMPEMVFRSERKTTEGQCASFSPVGDLIACGGSGTIEVDDIHTGGRYATFSDHLGHIESIVFSPDGRQLASCDGHGVLRLWDLASRKGWEAAPVRYATATTDTGEQNGVGYWCVAYSPNGTRIVTTSRDGMVDIWDASVTPQWTMVNTNEPGQMASPLVFFPDHKHLAIARHCTKSAQDCLQIWDVSLQRPTLVRNLGALSAQAACLSRDGTELVVGSPGKVEIYNTKTCESRLKIVLDGVPKAVAFDGRGSLLILEDANSKWAVHLMDSQTGVKVRTITDPTFASKGVSHNGFSVSADGNLLAVTPQHCRHTAVFELSTGQLLQPSLGHRGATGQIQFAPAGHVLAIAVFGGVELWDSRTGTEQAYFSGLGREVGPMAFSADGRLLVVVAREQRAVQLWDVRRCNSLFSLPLPAAAAQSEFWRLAVSADGRRISCSMADAEGNGGVYLFSGVPSELAAREN